MKFVLNIWDLELGFEAAATYCTFQLQKALASFSLKGSLVLIDMKIMVPFRLKHI